jgi:hypothetical protein
MSRIELFGPLGIGKSTLQDRLLNSGEESHLKLYSPQEARRMIAHRLRFQDGSAKGLLYRHLLDFPYRRISAKAAAYFTTRLELSALSKLPIESRNGWKAFSTEVSTILSQYNDPSTSATVASWIEGGITEAVFLDSYCPNDMVIVDEGVAKRALAIVPPPPRVSGLRSAFRRLSGLLPNHPTYVHLDASHEVILEHIERRRKQGSVARPHRGMTPEDLADFSNRYADAARFFADCLRERGATVIAVNAESSIDSNLGLLLERFARLATPRDAAVPAHPDSSA